MKIFEYLFMAFILLGMCACDNENENTPDPGEGNKTTPVISFKEKNMTVDENAGTLNVPLSLTKAADTTTTVYIAIKKGSLTGGLEGAPYATVPTCVTLEKGSTEGTLTLRIIDNITPNPDCSFTLEITKAEGNVEIGKAGATCQITIKDDEINNFVRFSGPANDTAWHEEAGTIEIPLIFAYGTSDKNISGKIVVDSTYGCTAGDFELLTTSFAVNGEDTLKIKVKLVNNETFGDWGFRLALQDLKGGCPITPKYIVKIKDDERILGFKSTTYTVNEGESINIYTFLKGGAAQNHIPVSIAVVSEQTTAEPTQYSLPVTYNPIYKGNETSYFNLRTFKHPSRQDKILALKITTTATGPGDILTDTTQFCRVTIKNTDEFVGFAEDTISGLSVGNNSIPLKSSGFDEDMMVYVKVKSSGMNASDYKLVSDFVRIPAGQKSGNIQLKLENAMKPVDEIVLEITRVVFANSGEDNSQLDPECITCTCKAQN